MSIEQILCQLRVLAEKELDALVSNAEASSGLELELEDELCMVVNDRASYARYEALSKAIEALEDF